MQAYLEFSPLRLLWVDIVDDWIQFIIPSLACNDLRKGRCTLSWSGVVY